MAQQFQHIGLIGKYADPSVGETLQMVGNHLQSRGLDILLDEATAEVWTDHDMAIASRSPAIS